MGINCKIYLPAHVKTDHVFEVIQKTVGCDFVKETFSENSYGRVNGKRVSKSVPVPFDSDSPASESNPWHMNMVKDGKREIELKETSYFNFNFRDLADNHYSCLYLLDTDNSDEYALERGCKSLGPPPTGVWCVIGKRLVDFFGGKILYSDAGNYDDLNNWYSNDNPIFPFKDPNESSNDVWYRYQNALNKTPLISINEIKAMSQVAAYFNNERDIKLINYLEKYERFESLDSALLLKSDNNIKKPKI